MVLAVTSEVQPDKLRRTEVWLARCGEAEQLAVLVDFVPVSLAATRPYAPGESFEAELAFYPSATPLRAIVTERTGSATKEERWSTPACDVATAIARYQTALATRPWLGRWPMAIGHAIVTREHDRLHLTHAEGGMALPIRTTEDDMALPLVGVDNIDAFGLWDGRQLDLRFAETPLGRWRAA